jgi:lactate racemase
VEGGCRLATCVVDFQDESLEFEVPSEREVAAWRGPRGVDPDAAKAAVGEALERPRDFPPLRQMIVPGDQVTIALDPEIPECQSVLDALVGVLGEAGVEPAGITVLTTTAGPSGCEGVASMGGTIAVHDPDDRAGIAYLASTKEGRRIYLNRLLTDADVVVPVGLLRPDAELGHRGPWSLLFPGLSDRQTMQALRDRAGGDSPGGQRRREARFEESSEVGWLLGAQFALGIVPGAIGLLEIVAGRDTAVREAGIAAIDHHWTMHAPSRAEVVIAGVGGSGSSATLEDLAMALDTARGLVQHGGKIVILSRAAGPIGPALRRLTEADDPREAVAVLRGLEDVDDYSIARRVALASDWADLFVCSGLDAEIAEGLAIAPLERPEQARRLALNAGSVTFLSRAELTRAQLQGD